MRKNRVHLLLLLALASSFTHSHGEDEQQQLGQWIRLGKLSDSSSTKRKEEDQKNLAENALTKEDMEMLMKEVEKLEEDNVDRRGRGILWQGIGKRRRQQRRLRTQQENEVDDFDNLSSYYFDQSDAEAAALQTTGFDQGYNSAPYGEYPGLYYGDYLQPSEDKSPSNPVYSRRQDGYGAPLAPPVVAPPPPAPAPSYGPPPAPPPPAPPPAPTYGAPRPPPPPVLPPNVPPSAPGPDTYGFYYYYYPLSTPPTPPPTTTTTTTTTASTIEFLWWDLTDEDLRNLFFTGLFFSFVFLPPYLQEAGLARRSFSNSGILGRVLPDLDAVIDTLAQARDGISSESLSGDCVRDLICSVERLAEVDQEREERGLEGAGMAVRAIEWGLDLMPYMGWLFHMDPRAEQLSQALEGADVLNKNRRKKRFDNFERNKCQPMVTCLDYKK